MSFCVDVFPAQPARGSSASNCTIAMAHDRCYANDRRLSASQTFCFTHAQKNHQSRWLRIGKTNALFKLRVAARPDVMSPAQLPLRPFDAILIHGKLLSQGEDVELHSVTRLKPRGQIGEHCRDTDGMDGGLILSGGGRHRWLRGL